ncbi:Serine/threonine-protein kinase Nek7, partial [Fragariocoptes setiger]
MTTTEGQLTRPSRSAFSTYRRTNMPCNNVASFVVDHTNIDYKPAIEIVRPIGRGQFSDVYKAVWLNAPLSITNNSTRNSNNSSTPTTNDNSNNSVNDNDHHRMPVALKRIKIIDMRDAKARIDCLKETELLQQLDHPNIVRYFTSFIDNNDLFIVLELAEAGDLSKLIKGFRQNERHVPERTIWKYFRQLACAVAYMHSRRVLHRDIKPANVFMTSGGCVKLGDFGLGRYFGPQTIDAHTLVGTFYYMSPERIRNDGYEFSSDVWSVGCVLYELAALRPPFVVSPPSERLDRTGHYHTPNVSNCAYYRLLPNNRQQQQQHNHQHQFVSAATTPATMNSHDHGLQALIARIESGIFEPICGEARFSSTLVNLVSQCLRASATQRPTMESVHQLAEWCFAQYQTQTNCVR